MDDFMEEEIRQEVVSNHQITDRIARSNKAENILKNVETVSRNAHHAKNTEY